MHPRHGEVWLMGVGMIARYRFRVGKAAEKCLVPWANPAFGGLREFRKRL